MTAMPDEARIDIPSPNNREPASLCPLEMVGARTTTSSTSACRRKFGLAGEAFGKHVASGRTSMLVLLQLTFGSSRCVSGAIPRSTSDVNAAPILQKDSRRALSKPCLPGNSGGCLYGLGGVSACSTVAPVERCHRAGGTWARRWCFRDFVLAPL